MAFLGEKNNIFEGWWWDDPERFFSLEKTEWTPRTLTTLDQIEVVEARINSIFSALGNKISLSDPQGQLANLIAEFSALEQWISLVDPQGQLADLIAEKARLIWILIWKPQQTAQTLQ